MLAPACQDQPSIHWHGWSDDGGVACIVLLSDENATVWMNLRLVNGRLYPFVDLWARYAIGLGAACDILFSHELDVLRSA